MCNGSSGGFVLLIPGVSVVLIPGVSVVLIPALISGLDTLYQEDYSLAPDISICGLWEGAAAVGMQFSV